MPSKYYNPRLARNLAAAYSQQVPDFMPGVEKAFDKAALNLEKRRLERKEEEEKYRLEMQKRDKENNTFFEKMVIIDPNTLHSSIQDYATQDMFKKQQEYRVAVETLDGYDRIKKTTELNNSIGFWKTINENLSEYQQDYLDRRDGSQAGGDQTSAVNDAVTLELDRRKANMDFQSVKYDADGNLVAVFEPQEGSAITESVEIRFDQWNQNKPLEKQTKKFVEIIDEFDTMILNSVRQGRFENDQTNISETESKLNSIKFSSAEAMSIAVDYLGYDTEEASGLLMKDYDGDKKAGTIDDMNKFIKDNIRQTVFTRLQNLRLDYEKKLKDAQAKQTPTATELKLIEKNQKIESTAEKLKNAKFAKDEKGNLEFDSAVFINTLADLGYTIVGEPKIAETGKKALVVKNNYTNKNAFIENLDLNENNFKRILFTLIQPDQAEIDRLFPYSQIGPKNITLPGTELEVQTPFTDTVETEQMDVTGQL